MLINNDTYQRETVSERPNRQPLNMQVVTLFNLQPDYNIMNMYNDDDGNLI